MTYSQKYVLVQFLQKTDEGESFHMTDWPLHVTLADVFAVDITDSLFEDMQQYLDAQPITRSHVKGSSLLGTTDVWLLDDTPDLCTLHTQLVDILEKHGAIFNSPDFTRDGFIPHITKQPGSDMGIGDKVIINTFSLVDMFPGKDWQRRKVIKHFKPRLGV